MSNLIIDSEKCIGCGKCAQMCVANNISVVDGKAQENGAGCIRCGHCVSSCPQGAIQLTASPGAVPFQGTPGSGWFDGTLVSPADIQAMYMAMDKGFCDFRTLQGDDLDSFMEEAFDVLKSKTSEIPVVGQWEKWRENHNLMEPNPVLWEGKQVLFIFSESPNNALEASNRMIAKGFTLGIRGFHSNVLMMAWKTDPERIMSHFPGMTLPLRMAFVIGHPRRMVEPLFNPVKKIAGLFRGN